MVLLDNIKKLMVKVMTNRYQDILSDMQESLFLRENGDNSSKLITLVENAVAAMIARQGDGPIYPSDSDISITDVMSSAAIPERYNFSHSTTVEQVANEMQRSVKAHSPLMVKNIIPQPNFVYLAAYVATSLYMGNAVTGEDAGEALKDELSCASAIAKMAGMDPTKASGVFTFGGTGTNLYAVKIGLAKAKPKHALEGVIDNDTVVIGNAASHYSQQTSANWTGIGQNNYLKVKTNIDQTTDLSDLEKVCRRALDSGKKIACIEAVGGTTSSMGMDDVEEIYKLRSQLIKEYSLSYTPHIHVDSVLGWVWLNFIDYDFDKNPLGFSVRVLKGAQHNASMARKFCFADSLGVDFRKTGYTPYNSSMVILKNKDDFNFLKRQKDIMTPLFHDENEYNPGIYTIETSRSVANIVATWATLKTIGKEGYQVLLGHALEMREAFVDREKDINAAGMIIENKNSATTDIFLRSIVTGSDVQNEHHKELYDDSILAANTEYTSNFYEWFVDREGKNPKIAFSKSSASFYNHNGKPVVAFRIVLLGVNCSVETINYLIDYIINAKKIFDTENSI